MMRVFRSPTLRNSTDKLALMLEEINKTNLVVDVAVGEHGVEILHALAGTAVKIVLQSFLDGAHVHWLFNDVVIILNEIREQVLNVLKSRLVSTHYM